MPTLFRRTIYREYTERTDNIATEFSGEDGTAGGHQDPVQGSKTQPGCSLDNPVDIAFW
jgi:hypothetical protein